MMPKSMLAILVALLFCFVFTTQAQVSTSLTREAGRYANVVLTAEEWPVAELLIYTYPMSQNVSSDDFDTRFSSCVWVGGDGENIVTYQPRSGSTLGYNKVSLSGVKTSELKCTYQYPFDSSRILLLIHSDPDFRSEFDPLSYSVLNSNGQLGTYISTGAGVSTKQSSLMYDLPTESTTPNTNAEGQFAFTYQEVYPTPLESPTFTEIEPDFFRFGNGNTTLFVEDATLKCEQVVVWDNGRIGSFHVSPLRPGHESYLEGFITVRRPPNVLPASISGDLDRRVLNREVICRNVPIRPTRGSATTSTNFSIDVFFPTLTSTSTNPEIAPFYGHILTRPVTALSDLNNLRVSATVYPTLCQQASQPSWQFQITSGVKLYQNEWISLASPEDTPTWNVMLGLSCGSSSSSVLQCGAAMTTGPRCQCRVVSTQTVTTPITITMTFIHQYDFDGRLIRPRPSSPDGSMASSAVFVTLYEYQQKQQYQTIVAPRETSGIKSINSYNPIVNNDVAKWECMPENTIYQKVRQNPKQSSVDGSPNVYDVSIWVTPPQFDSTQQQDIPREWTWALTSGSLSERTDLPLQRLFLNYSPDIFPGETPLIVFTSIQGTGGNGVFTTSCTPRGVKTPLSLRIECTTTRRAQYDDNLGVFQGFGTENVRVAVELRITFAPGVPANLLKYYEPLVVVEQTTPLQHFDLTLPVPLVAATQGYIQAGSPYTLPYWINPKLLGNPVAQRFLGSTFDIELELGTNSVSSHPLSTLIFGIDYNSTAAAVPCVEIVSCTPTQEMKTVEYYVDTTLVTKYHGFFVNQELTEDAPLVSNFQANCTLRVIQPQGVDISTQPMCSYHIRFGIPSFPGGTFDSELNQLIPTVDLAFTSSVSDESLDFQITHIPEYGWLCEWSNGEYIQCDSTKWETECQSNKNQTDVCSCTNQRNPICYDIVITEQVDAVNCNEQTLPTISTDITNYFQCQSCVSTIDPTKRFNAGPNCDIRPTITNFTYYPSGQQLQNGPLFTVDYNNTKVVFNMTYTGSPTNYITITAHSPSLAPFDKLVIASIPATTPFTEFIYDLSNLGVYQSVNDLTFTASIGDVINVETSFNNNPIVINTLPRCKSTNNVDLCQNGGICNNTTGHCECNKASIWQSGDLCEKSICPELNCEIKNIKGYNPNVDRASFTTTSCIIKTLDNNSYEPQCNCNDAFTGSTCSIPTTCSTQFPTNICPPSRGNAEFVTTDDGDDNTIDGECNCTCNDFWQNAPGQQIKCSRCALQCSNNGRVVTGACKRCSCPPGGAISYYGDQCECTGITLNANVPINSAQFSAIRNEREFINQVTSQIEGQSKLVENKGNLLTLIRESPLRKFMQSFFVSLLLDHRMELLRQGDGKHVTKLYTFDTISQKYVVNAQSLENIVYLKAFDVKEIFNPDLNRNTSWVVYNLLIIPDACYDAKSIVDDRTWSATLANLRAVANYAQLDDSTGIDKDIISVDIVDPQCIGATCQDVEPDNDGSNNNAFLMKTCPILFFTIIISLMTIITNIITLL